MPRLSCSSAANDLDRLVPYSEPRVWKCSSLKPFFSLEAACFSLAIRYRLPKVFSVVAQPCSTFQGPAKEIVRNVLLHLMRWHVSVPW
jgi:hypothetical protein